MSEINDASTLITKVLVPRRRDDVVSRARLLDQLYDMVDHRLLLVTAPAGYGKTTLLVDFAADLEHPVCWYSLDATDRDPRLFLERLILSLERRFPGVGQDLLHALASGADLRDGAPGIVRMLINTIVARIPQWFVLVLDDYHTLGPAPEIGAIVSNFVAYQRDQCMTIIASRSVPEIPLIISFVARGGVGGLGQVDVRFDPDEVRTLFAQNYATDLSLREARDLAEQFEGWVTGLILTAHVQRQDVLQRWLRTSGPPATGAESPVYDYLAQEVFERRQPAMQRFLLRSSVLEQMSATLCREILAEPDADRFLDALVVENLFVTQLEEVDGEAWSRYHHLFREFLQSRFRRADPSGWAALHLETARWFEAAGQVREAVAHYLTAGAPDAAAQLMAAAAPDLYRRGHLATLLAWREALPQEVLARTPRLALFQAQAASKLGDVEVALALAEVAETGYREAGTQACGNREGAIYARLVRSEVWLSQGRPGSTLALARSALDLVEQDDVLLSYEAHRVLGLAYTSTGEVDAGRAHLEKALALSRLQASDYDRALIRTGLAYCLGLQGELAAAVALHQETVELWRSLGSEGGLMDELSDLGFHLYALGRYEEAVPHFREALTLCRRLGSRRGEAYLLVSLGELARDLGALEPAAAYCERGRTLAGESGIGFLAGYSCEALGLVHRAGGCLTEAAEEIEKALAAAGADYPAGRYRASLGVVHAERGAFDEALHELAEAVRGLERVKLPTEQHRARLFQAWALYLSGEEEAGVAALGRLLDDVPEGAESVVFDAEAVRMSRLFEAARRAWQTPGPQRDPEAKARVYRLKRIEDRAATLAPLGARLFPPGEMDLTTSPAAGVGAAGSPTLHVYGFGAGRVEVGGEALSAAAWGAASARHLLFYLLVQGARTREQIMDELWPALSAQKAKAAFHTAKFRLNRALQCEAVDYDGMLYSLRDTLLLWFDVHEFERELAAWRRTQQPAHARQALALYRGDFLQECYMDWCVEERESLRARCLQALDELAVRLLSRRQYRRATETLQQALALDPARETFHVQLMRAFVFCGERSRALAQYARCRAALHEHLAADPSAETVRLYEQILREAPLE